MLSFTLEQLHAAIGGELALATDDARQAPREPLRRAVTDSRQVQPGDVFWALPGLVRNGAEFAEEARQRGAAGIVAQSDLMPSARSWTLRVQDSLRCLWRLAEWQREQFDGRLVAVTGSIGKTTTRLMIDSLLSRGGNGSTSPHNYNNHVGLPLSLLALRSTDDYAVLELGASAAGEIAELAGLCRPEIGVVTQIGEAHLGGFGSSEAIAQAKTELLESLPSNGIAVLNGDDPWLQRLASRSAARIVWVGRSGTCDLKADRVAYRAGRLNMSVDGLDLEVPVWGRHYCVSVLMAVAVAREFGVPSAEIVDAMAGFETPQLRCQVSRVRGAIVINDSYNASPTAMRAALELLEATDAAGRRIVVCGDMRELGPESENWHRRVGDEVVTICGADELVACGHYAQDIVGAARRAGMNPERTVSFRHVEDAARHIDQMIEPGDVVLVKGSRALAMERIVQRLEAEPLKRAA